MTGETPEVNPNETAVKIKWMYKIALIAATPLRLQSASFECWTALLSRLLKDLSQPLTSRLPLQRGFHWPWIQACQSAEFASCWKEQKRNCTHSHSYNGAESCTDYSKIPHCHKKNVKHNVCATRQYRENKMICGLSAVTRYDWLSICQHITKPYGIITLP